MTAQSRNHAGRRPGRNPATYAYVSATSLLAIALAGVGWRMFGPPLDYVALVVLTVLGVVGSLWRREAEVTRRVDISFTSIVLVAAAVLVGPVGAGLIGAVAAATQSGRAAPLVRIFNIAMVSCLGSISGLAYLLVGGETAVGSLAGAREYMAQVGFPLMVADIAQCVANAILLAGVMRAASGIPMRSQVGKLLSTTGPAYIGYGIIGFLFVILWIPAKVGWFSALLVLAPLFVARWAFIQYGDELRSHERTLDALVASVEAKDPSSVGHSGRVAQLCEWMAEAMGLGHKEVEEIRTAGMLHDLGKLAIPSRVLRIRRERTDEEQVVMAAHPMHAVSMLEDIEFVRGSLEGIAHHHERYDGRGYPSGLAGPAIPLAARIIAVADAFDALTTTRAYRGALTPTEALEELKARGGTHLDPSVVAALGRALARHTWSVTERSAALLSAAGMNRDHDDPESSDAYAAREDLRAQVLPPPAPVHAESQP
jgi:HD-GYP domain-containing protein (c-di-GMP phosphodiesterase class II)